MCLCVCVFVCVQVEGPVVLQVQRVRNVAQPSSKQFVTGQSSRRLLRVQLTDGRVSLPGLEMEGAIANLRCAPPPLSLSLSLSLSQQRFVYVYMCMYVCVCCVSVCLSSTQTPPGTKVLLFHKTEVQRGFLLLGKTSLKVLGGRVEHLLQKWTLTKVGDTYNTLHKMITTSNYG